MTEIQLPIGLGINHFFVPQNSKYCPPMRTHGNHEQKTVHAWIDSNADGKLTEVVGMNLMTEPFIATSEIVLPLSHKRLLSPAHDDYAID